MDLAVVDLASIHSNSAIRFTLYHSALGPNWIGSPRRCHRNVRSEVWLHQGCSDLRRFAAFGTPGMKVP
jgi:hypothetical protein